MTSPIDTKKQILDLAENLLLDRGYNGFSYKDISGALGIRNASIHYHFPKKTDLGVAIIQRATRRFEKWAQLTAEKNVRYSRKLSDFCRIFQKYIENDRQVCLGGALETDFKTLPKEMQQETITFISTMFLWLEKFLAEGRSEGEFKFPGSPKDLALLILSSLQGAIQIARVTTPSSFNSTVKQIKSYICV
jgi:TetR/AcrR family transcriptional regulator, transcriptional repressor for nem operon